jgi:hydroxyacylglutathione hydrolase
MVKKIVGTLAVLLALLVAAAVGLRATRGNFEAPRLLRPGLAQVKAGHVYIYAARVGPQVVLFDAGQDPGGAAVDALLKLLGANREAVHDIFLTHAHGDHLAAAPLFAQSRLWAGAGDAALAQGKQAPEALAARLFNFIMPPPQVTITQALTTDERVALSPQHDVQAFALPGHTPGSYAYLFDHVLFVGDSLHLADGTLQPPWALFDAHPQENLASLTRLQARVDPTTNDTVCTAHAGCTDAGRGPAALRAFVAAHPPR